MPEPGGSARTSQEVSQHPRLSQKGCPLGVGGSSEILWCPSRARPRDVTGFQPGLRRSSAGPTLFGLRQDGKCGCDLTPFLVCSYSMEARSQEQEKEMEQVTEAELGAGAPPPTGSATSVTPRPWASGSSSIKWDHNANDLTVLED